MRGPLYLFWFVSTVVAQISIDPELVVDFGVTPGNKTSVLSDCIGFNDVVIPCSCPPEKDVYIVYLDQFVTDGLLDFPTGNCS